MKPVLFSLATFLLLGVTAQAQGRRPFIRSLGQGSVSVQPDQAKIDIGW